MKDFALDAVLSAELKSPKLGTNGGLNITAMVADECELGDIFELITELGACSYFKVVAIKFSGGKVFHLTLVEFGNRHQTLKKQGVDLQSIWSSPLGKITDPNLINAIHVGAGQL